MFNFICHIIEVGPSVLWKCVLCLLKTRKDDIVSKVVRESSFVVFSFLLFKNVIVVRSRVMSLDRLLFVIFSS